MFQAADRFAPNVNAMITLCQKPLVVQVPRNPSNSMTKLASALVNNIDPTTDIRFQLVWNFGGFLADVPRVSAQTQL
jgi:hypothetical protein